MTFKTKAHQLSLTMFIEYRQGKIRTVSQMVNVVDDLGTSVFSGTCAVLALIVVQLQHLASYRFPLLSAIETMDILFLDATSYEVCIYPDHLLSTKKALRFIASDVPYFLVISMVSLYHGFPDFPDHK